ncbi:MAG: methyltransferase domain-containing protein [Microcystis viridis Mv_BB_P_19951000_S69]|uniref:Methyltransferase domain-containing protein n=1 Tax=Microcystis viridis Mv_BB_P_19951000_S68D TaxID=2486270 RepID=A0A552HR29_MICVR|nr:MAG: methyltransferase domain-containing protein [Microcystis viridis Mv_BB_P_19951000_S68]TRU73234.1 MAG: methyltransferase domain-containing protein [Microcystis viridis Mv_BB_P_19951000_S69]TRU73681.1 MAG: methyltransferase domain-containing protein [Microcystis viridis Mv_BB_P_19951000_S68D]TRU80680.1 MAG: methyltransferase domain-containing protein [Microcystis viridis Mv_BB_P_19951000_S69D]
MTIETYYPNLNVKHLLDKIRQEALRQNLAPGVPSAPVPPPPAATGELVLKGDFDREAINNQIDYIEGFIKTAESRAAVRDQLPDKFGRFPWLLFKPLQALALKILNTIFRDQREVNFNLASALRECLQLNRQLLSEVENLRSQSRRDLENLMAVSQSLSGYSQAVEKNLVNNTQNLEEKLHNLDQKWQERQQQNQDELQGEIQELEREMQTQIEQLDQKRDRIANQIQEGLQTQIEQLDRELYQKTEQLQEYLETQIKDSNEKNFQNSHYLKIDLLQQKRLINKFLEVTAGAEGGFSSEPAQIFAGELDHSLDAFYFAFEERFRGSREEINQRLEVYLPRLREAQIAPGDSLILDLGCGRGEWLELLRDNGYRARGIDLNRVVIEQCQSRGLDVLEGDVIAYLQSMPDDSVAVITGFHIIEHLPFEILVKLLNEAFRVLRQRGLVIFETPNPANVLVGSCNFYFDPTHRNPLPSLMTQFLVQYCGFAQVEILNLNPSDGFKADEGNELDELSKQFNQYFYGPMDYAVIGYKL